MKEDDILIFNRGSKALTGQLSLTGETISEHSWFIEITESEDVVSELCKLANGTEIYNCNVFCFSAPGSFTCPVCKQVRLSITQLIKFVYTRLGFLFIFIL